MANCGQFKLILFPPFTMDKNCTKFYALYKKIITLDLIDQFLLSLLRNTFKILVFRIKRY